ncbi:hypothetical protein C0J52_03207 [Blattella germanica]|nr:hypothetical protein C0J52_03207 [Blattella germanica]
MNELPKEHLRDILKSILRDEGLDEESKYSIREHATHLWVSSIYRIAVRHGMKEDLLLFFKCLPEDLEQRETWDIDSLFKNEVEFYSEILNSFLKFQEKRNVANPFCAIPKCYRAQSDGKNDVIILEDLQPRGFVTLDNRKLPGLPELQIIMKELGRFHALSLAMKDQEPDNFEKLKTAIKETVFYDKFFNRFGELYDYAAEKAIELVKQNFQGESIYVEKLKPFENGIANRMLNLARAKDEDEPYNVITHADLSIANVLIRYCEKLPVELKIIDFQTCRYGSVALDIAAILYCSIEKTTRDEHQHTLLRCYHDNLCELLSDLGSDPEKLLPYEALENQLKKYSEFGLWMAVFNLPHGLDDGVSDTSSNANETEIPKDIISSLKAPYTRKTAYYPETKYTIKDHDFRLWVSTIHRIAVHCRPGIKESDLFLFFKSLPEKPEVRQVFNSDIIFGNEMGFYNEILSSLLKFQESKCVKNPFNAVPKCYKAVRNTENYVIVLEDLEPQGFIMLNRHKQLGLSEVHLLMKELGRFHALCLAMKHQEAENFKKMKKGVQEILYSEKFIEKFGELYEYVKNDAVKLVKQNFPHDSPYVKKLEQYANNTMLAKRMQELARPKEEDEPYNVFNHRDLWVNNFLYKYSDKISPTKEPIALKILDFQACQYGSPGLDVPYVLLNSANKQMRDEHGDSLLHSYYDNLCELLSELGSDPKQVFPYEVLMSHIKKYSEYGLWLTLFNLPHTLDKGENVAAVTNSGSDATENIILSSLTGAYTRRTEECKKRLLDSIVYVIDNGYL